MKLTLIFSLFCLIGLYIQGTLIKALAPGAVVPDFIIVLVMFVALNFPSVLGIVGAFALGLAADFASGIFLGPNAAGAVCVFMFTAFVAKKVYAENFIAIAILGFLCSLAKTATVVLLLSLYVNVDVISGNTVTVFVEALLTAIVSPIVMKLLQFTRRGASSP